MREPKATPLSGYNRVLFNILPAVPAGVLGLQAGERQLRQIESGTVKESDLVLLKDGSVFLMVSVNLPVPADQVKNKRTA